jgi:amidase
MAVHLAQIERFNPKLNALVTLIPEQAMEQAKKADEALAKNREVGPLHGLPVGHKDLFQTQGIRTTFGSPVFRISFQTMTPDRGA